MNPGSSHGYEVINKFILMIDIPKLCVIDIKRNY